MLLRYRNITTESELSELPTIQSISKQIHGKISLQVRKYYNREMGSQIVTPSFVLFPPIYTMIAQIAQFQLLKKILDNTLSAEGMRQHIVSMAYNTLNEGKQYYT